MLQPNVDSNPSTQFMNISPDASQNQDEKHPQIRSSGPTDAPDTSDERNPEDVYYNNIKNPNLQETMREEELDTQQVPIRRQYMCKYPTCKKKYNQLSSLHRHYKAQHLKIRYVCPMCNKQFSLK